MKWRSFWLNDALSPAMKPFDNGVRSFALPIHATSRNDKIVRVILINSDAFKCTRSIIAYCAARPFRPGGNRRVHKGGEKTRYNVFTSS